MVGCIRIHAAIAQNLSMHKLIYWEMKSRPKKANGKFDTLKVKRKWE